MLLKINNYKKTLLNGMDYDKIMWHLSTKDQK